MYTYKYPHPAVTADCAVFGLSGEELRVLLIQRRSEPYRNSWALPGGFVEAAEDLHEAALRELKEETGIDKIEIEQLGAWGAPGRDPRERVITVAFCSIVKISEQSVISGSDAGDAGWFPVGNLPELAFDHGDIIKAAIRRLRLKLQTERLDEYQTEVCRRAAQH